MQQLATMVVLMARQDEKLNTIARRVDLEALSVDTNHLLLTFTRIQISEGQSDKQSASNHVSGGAVEQVVQRFANSQGAAPQHRHRERSHVSDRVLKTEIYEDEHDKNEDQDFGNFLLATQRYPHSQTDNPVGQNPFEEDYASCLMCLVQGAVE